MSEFHFLRPWWLLAILPAGLIAWRLWSAEDDSRSMRKLVAPHLLPHLLTGHEKRNWFRPIVILVITWVLSVVAIAGPAWQREPAPFAEDSARLVIVMKVTPSMQSQDVQPTRLGRASEKIHDLLQLRPGAKTSLFAYAGSTHRVMPFTSDTGIITSFAAELSPEVMPVEGSAAAAALAAADEALKKSGQVGWILWITDGATAKEAQELGQYRAEGQAPVSVLAVAGDGPELESLQQAATVLGAPLVRVTADDTDVKRLASNTRFSSIAEQAGGDRWRDFGYWLVWPVIGLSLLWFRRGWMVRVSAGG